MKIRKMTAHFGALDGAELELGEGLNILYAPNESGKSTWCAFLRAMLYGVSTSQRARAGQKPDRVKYRPWSGTPMSGSMELETPDGPVTIRRWTERDAQPMQVFSATVTGTDVPAFGLDAETAGEKLTGMPAEVFERSVFIRQSGMEVQSDPELERRINAIVTSGDEAVSFFEAEKRLRAWQRRRQSGNRGAIPELREELDGARRSLDTIREHTRAAAAADEEIEALETRLAETEERMHAARASLRKRSLAELGEARATVREAEELCDKAESALEDAETKLEETPFGGGGPEAAEEQAAADRARMAELRRAAERPLPAAGLVLSVILALAAFVLAFVLPWRAVCVGAGCLFAVLAAWSFFRRQEQRRLRENAANERARLLASYGVGEPAEIDGLLDAYASLWRDKERAERRLETAEAALAERRTAQRETENRTMDALDFTGGDNEAARAAREIESIRARVGELKERRAMAEGQARALGDPVALESGLAEGERRYTELLRQNEALTLALDTLTRADTELQQRLSPLLAKKAAEYFSVLTDGRYDEVTLARDLTAKTRRTGDDVGRELDYLSAGTRDQLYLALRLAVCDLALPGDDPCPIILDDALVTFDGERMALALGLMKQIARERQVLLFSCHRRETEYFAADPDVAKITVEGREGP